MPETEKEILQGEKLKTQIDIENFGRGGGGGGGVPIK